MLTTGYRTGFMDCFEYATSCACTIGIMRGAGRGRGLRHNEMRGPGRGGALRHNEGAWKGRGLRHDSWLVDLTSL